jgi:sugar lactone lactonase YvrE
MAIQGDTLWVADIDVVRGFNRETGAPLRTITFPMPITLLNDVAVAPDGTMYVTDTGIAMTDKGVLKPGGDKVIAITPAGEISVRADSMAVVWPNGVTWDAHGSRWIVVTFEPFDSKVFALPPSSSGDAGPATPIASGAGRFDGVEVLGDGTLLVTGWKDHALHMITPDGTDRKIVGALTQPADIGVDTRRNRVAIPQPLRGVVDVWTLPPGM